MSSWESYLEAHQPRFVDELLSFLRIPSISAIPSHAADVQRAAEWVAARVAAAGLEHVEILPTGGHPVVYADWLHAPGKPTVLIYGHFDVQPVDPVDLWTHPPFEPHIIDGKVYARGASDDKGNMLVPILALEALLQSIGHLPVNVKVFFEGQEEIGSPQIGAFLPQHKDRFACDLVLNADGGQYSETEPAILVALRGGCGVQIDVKAAKMDLHSGLYGGVVMNPIHALVMILDSMRSRDGRITIEGFYDQIRPLTDLDRERIAAVPFDPDAIMADLDVPDLFGEAGYTPQERAWARPTLEVNGVWGGFQDPGIKTVLPSMAHAKITCRLVADQDPERIVQLLQAHVDRHTPPGVTATVTPLPFRASPYLTEGNDHGNQVVREVLVELYGREPYYVRSGGSIPVCSLFQQHLGVYSASLGFGLDDERQHSPDEFFRLASFRRGQTAYCMTLERLGR
ncbi:dipeptidase [Candidatus Chloroploca asiatica]|uniref:Peptidase M20 n=1 Tax=Candidatus Chloroploca asiatica TaxID=1506545 RepID=A0A2H3KRX5_9CHLR|nr:dipeptidase [Candidatus Chloroploca asiatica]PDW01434.1 peptidase M20 [Candidatus Chloroploca asiatica]